jgi:hypothetical protein
MSEREFKDEKVLENDRLFYILEYYVLGRDSAVQDVYESEIDALTIQKYKEGSVVIPQYGIDEADAVARHNAKSCNTIAGVAGVSITGGEETKTVDIMRHQTLRREPTYEAIFKMTEAERKALISGKKTAPEIMEKAPARVQEVKPVPKTSFSGNFCGTQVGKKSEVKTSTVSAPPIRFAPKNLVEKFKTNASLAFQWENSAAGKLAAFEKSVKGIINLSNIPQEEKLKLLREIEEKKLEAEKEKVEEAEIKSRPVPKYSWKLVEKKDGGIKIWFMQALWDADEMLAIFEKKYAHDYPILQEALKDPKKWIAEHPTVSKTASVKSVSTKPAPSATRMTGNFMGKVTTPEVKKADNVFALSSETIARLSKPPLFPKQNVAKPTASNFVERVTAKPAFPSQTKQVLPVAAQDEKPVIKLKPRLFEKKNLGASKVGFSGSAAAYLV